MHNFSKISYDYFTHRLLIPENSARGVFEDSRPRSFSKEQIRDSMEILITTSIVFITYWQYRYHSIPGGDAGELLAESCRAGTAHPPGYPLTIFLNRVVIAVSSYFWKNEVTPAAIVNIFNCAMGTLACYMVAHSVRRLLSKSSNKGCDEVHNKLSSVSGALAGASFALSPLAVEYSVGSEVFALNNLLCIGIIYCTIQTSLSLDFIHNKREAKIMKKSSVNSIWFRYVYIGAFLCGSGLANQHTSLILELVLVPYVVFRMRARLKLQDFANILTKSVFCFLLGIFPPYYLLIQSSSIPKEGSWGGDLRSFEAFLRHFTRKEYGTFTLSPLQGSERFLQRIFIYVQTGVVNEFGYTGVFFIILGIGACLSLDQKSDSRFVRQILIFSFVVYAILWNGIFSSLPISTNPMAAAVSARFYLQPNLLLSLFLGIGFHKALAIVINIELVRKHRLVFGRIISFVFVLHIVENVGKNCYWSIQGNRGTVMLEYAKAILQTIPSNQASLLISHTDLDWNTVRYLRLCENFAPHPTVSHVNIQLLPFPWFQRQIQHGLFGNTIFPAILPNVSTNRFDKGNTQLIIRFLRENLRSGSFPGGVYLEMQAVNEADIGYEGRYQDEFSLIPWGLTYRVFPLLENSTEPFAVGSVLAHAKNRIDTVKVSLFSSFANSQFPPGSWEFGATSIYWDMHYQYGLALLTHALALRQNNDMANNPEIFIRHVKSLDNACYYLGTVFNGVERLGAFTSVKNDLWKNSSLCYISLNGVVKVSKKLKGQLEGLPIYNDKAERTIEHNAKVIVGIYLTRTDRSTDPNTWDIYHKYYNDLWGINIVTTPEQMSSSQLESALMRNGSNSKSNEKVQKILIW